jgi:hypothetical protein
MKPGNVSERSGEGRGTQRDREQEAGTIQHPLHRLLNKVITLATWFCPIDLRQEEITNRGNNWLDLLLCISIRPWPRWS